MCASRRFSVLLLTALMAAMFAACTGGEPSEPYENALMSFMDALKQKDFDAMYALITPESAGETPKETFSNRYKNIYGSVDAKNIEVVVNRVESQSSGAARVHFTMTMDTVAGELTAENYIGVRAIREGGEVSYLIDWAPHVIFPGLTAERPVRVDTLKAKMGSIYDRDGRLLAGDGTIKAVGIVAPKLSEDTRDEDVARIAELIGMDAQTLNEKLGAAWVKEGYVVPVAELQPQDVETKDKLLSIPGVRIDDKKGRIYPYGREFSQEDKYLDRLRGTDGHRIVITDASGNELITLKEQPAVDGESIRLSVSVDD